MDTYEKYEQDCEKIRSVNSKLLDEFETWLVQKKLSPKTIKKHSSNVDFYINDFLLYEDAIEAKDGVGSVGMFLGYWFIRKAMWTSQTSIKENASSLKIFYQYMLEKGFIDKQDLVKLKLTIKEDTPEWLATLSRYDDPYIEDMEEVWGLK
jgi:site-specific recombinase XerD